MCSGYPPAKSISGAFVKWGVSHGLTGGRIGCDNIRVDRQACVLPYSFYMYVIEEGLKPFGPCYYDDSDLAAPFLATPCHNTLLPAFNTCGGSIAGGFDICTFPFSNACLLCGPGHIACCVNLQGTDGRQKG